MFEVLLRNEGSTQDTGQDMTQASKFDPSPW